MNLSLSKMETVFTEPLGDAFRRVSIGERENDCCLLGALGPRAMKVSYHLF